MHSFDRKRIWPGVIGLENYTKLYEIDEYK
jgi:hypothetical protein